MERRPVHGRNVLKESGFSRLSKKRLDLDELE